MENRVYLYYRSIYGRRLRRAFISRETAHYLFLKESKLQNSELKVSKRTMTSGSDYVVISYQTETPELKAAYERQCKNERIRTALKELSSNIDELSEEDCDALLEALKKINKDEKDA